MLWHIQDTTNSLAGHFFQSLVADTKIAIGKEPPCEVQKSNNRASLFHRVYEQQELFICRDFLLVNCELCHTQMQYITCVKCAFCLSQFNCIPEFSCPDELRRYAVTCSTTHTNYTSN